MKTLNNFRNIALGCIVLVTLLLIESCECTNSPEHITLLVVTGERSNCGALLEKIGSAAHPKVTFTCPKEKVTICWSSSGVSNLTLKIGGTTKSIGASGSEVVTITGDTDISIVPTGAKCATTQVARVEVVDGPTPTHWDGAWEADCGKISFVIDEMFVSKGLVAVDIMADFYPTVSLPYGNVLVCETPPFLNGTMVQESFGFEIDKPKISETLGRPLQAAGKWEFKWVAKCETEWRCNTLAAIPFNLTLDCK